MAGETTPFTIEHVIKAVARERMVDENDLRAAFVGTDSKIRVRSKSNSKRFPIIVTTRAHEESKALAMLQRNISASMGLSQDDSLLEGKVFDWLSASEIIDIVMNEVCLSDLKPWITSVRRNSFRGYQWPSDEGFWATWCGKSFDLPWDGKIRKPTHGEYRTLDWIRLEDEVHGILADRTKIREFLEEQTQDHGEFDEELIRRLLTQCYFDSDRLANKLLDAVGGVEKLFDLDATPEGFMLRKSVSTL